jgi:predicted RNA polymerase sigma factor
VRTALMLQTVLGLEASHIAKAYLVPEATLAQRLVRAKQKIKLARLPFDIPQRADMPERLDAVLEAAYGAYAVHYSAAQDHATRDGDLALACDTADADLGREALYLAQLLSELLPDVPEVQGLAALLCYSESRRAARLGAGGGFVALAAQDTRLWNSALIAQGNDLLRRAQTSQMGRFQIEAAIQSAHTERWYGRATDWNAIAQLYEALLRIAPSIGAQVAQASALTQAGHMEAALVRLDALHQSCEVQIASFQPYWVTRAHAERLAGRDQAAALSRDRAITLTTSTAVRHYLLSIK